VLFGVLVVARVAGVAGVEGGGSLPSESVSDAPRWGPHEAQAIEKHTTSVHRMRASYRSRAASGLTSLSHAAVLRPRAT
jgi:hypothetical protein